MAYETITVDATSTKSWSTTKTWNHTVSSGANRLLIVGVGIRNDDVTGITYGGVALTEVVSDTVFNASIWALANPAVGTGQISVTTDGSDSFAAGGLSVFGAAASAYNDGTDRDRLDGSGTLTSTVTPTIANGICVHCFLSTHDTAGTFGAGQTSITNSFSNDGGGMSYKTYSSTSAVSMSYTCQGIYQVIVCIKPALTSEISKTESVAVSENVVLDIPIETPVSEEVAITESTITTLISDVGPTESVTLSENVVLTIRDGLQISIWQENITVTDTPEFPGERDRFLEEAVSISEAVTVKLVNESNDTIPNIKVEW